MAEDDLKVAQLVLRVDPPFPSAGCYHAQQSAEKCLKGFLVAHLVPFKYVHELAYLVRLCRDIDAGFSELLTPATELQDYASDVRYPSHTAQPITKEDATEALQRAEQIRAFVLRALETSERQTSV
jgi:HEPN domain-containing protein